MIAPRDLPLGEGCSGVPAKKNPTAIRESVNV